MKKTKTKRRIVWAIDPFEEKSEARNHLLDMIRDLSTSGASIEPVYVLSPDEYDINIAFNAPWLKNIKPTAEKVLGHYLKDIQIPGIRAPQVLVEKRPSQTRAIWALSDYAKQKRADAIVVGTHARRGLARFFLGSFAETLLLHSKVPVLVVGPRSETGVAPARRIVFATDFGPTFPSAFKSVLNLAKVEAAAITLLHCLPHPVEPVFQSGVYLIGGGFVSYPDFFSKEEERKRKLADRCQALAAKQGISLTCRLLQGHGSTAQTIVDQAKKEKATAIAMIAESGVVAATLIGSVTRQVVRMAPCSVWVFRK